MTSKTVSGEPVNIAVVDDHGLLVESVSSWFAANAPDFAVVVQETS
jgi:hypothetical protein